MINSRFQIFMSVMPASQETKVRGSICFYKFEISLGNIAKYVLKTLLLFSINSVLIKIQLKARKFGESGKIEADLPLLIYMYWNCQSLAFDNCDCQSLALTPKQMNWKNSIENMPWLFLGRHEQSLHST